MGVRKLATIYHKLGDIFVKPYGLYRSRKLRKLFQNKQLTVESISSLKYIDLDSILSFDCELFKKVSSEIYCQNIKRLQKKDNIRVAFFCNTDSVWSCDKLYHLFENDERFEPVVIVPGFDNGTPITIREMYETTVRFFKERGYRTLGVYDDGSEISTWEKIGIPDIVFHLTPYTNMLPRSVNILTLPLSTLNVNIPYALGSSEDKWWYNTPGARLAWKQFVETNLSSEVIKNYARIGDSNVVVSGHPKTDSYFLNDLDEKTVQPIWKVAKGISYEKVKKIIYAPHHSIYNHSINFSTFHHNYKDIYQYAKEHPSTTSWIIKPHPLLKKACVTEGLFKDEETYDKYLDDWNNLPNASVVTQGDYVPLFLSSDAMITDSGSFIIEYQYVKKPLIILSRDDRTYNVLSKALLPGTYMVDGKDINKIYETIDTVLIGKDDYLKETRDILYDEILNLPLTGDVSFPSGNIYQYISSMVANTLQK